MSSKIETGHAKNVANFELLIEHVIALGAQYNPINPAITLTALQAKYTDATTAMQNLRSVKTDYDNATNAREIQFKDLQKLTTRIINALEAAGAAPQTIKDARTIVRKLRGTRTPEKNQHNPDVTDQPTEIQPNETQPETQHGTGQKSISQRSYDHMTENFAKLIQVVQTEPLYTPNEADLTVSSLQAYATQLNTSTVDVNAHIASYTSSLGQRNTAIYAANTGLPALSHSVKAYVKSIFGVNSSQYQAINKISIRQIIK